MTTDTTTTHITGICDWLADRRAANEYLVKEVPLDQLDGWRVDPETGDIGHHTGRFFTVTGLRVSGTNRHIGSWDQPIIHQPEHGILGILVKEFDGQPHLLLQAKMEPGNVNMLQLSPTVQATRSNYTRAHGGKPVPYLEHFAAPRRGTVVFDALQSEQGAWFLAKRNRNMVVRITEDVPVLDDFRWVGLDQIGELLRVDNLVNMDTRTVLSGAVPLRTAQPGDEVGTDSFPRAMRPPWDRNERPLHTTRELLSWFTAAKARGTMSRQRIPLSEVEGWRHADGVVTHGDGRHFTVLGVKVEASNREVSGWSQPMIAPRGQGVIALLARWIQGTPHVLINARTEAGAFDSVEMAPSMQCIPDNYRGLPPASWPPFAEQVFAAPPERIRFDSVHSEEGGRFYQAQNRYLLIEVGEDFPVEVPEDYVWMTPSQLADFVQYGNHVNVEARNLVACLGFLK